MGFFGKHRLPASLQRSFAGTQAAKAESASKDLSKKQLKSLLEVGSFGGKGSSAGCTAQFPPTQHTLMCCCCLCSPSTEEGTVHRRPED